MDLVPIRQFYPTTSTDSLQSSFSGFHGAPLQFFGYSSFVSLRRRIFCATQNTLYLDSSHHQNPSRKSNYGFQNKPSSLNCSSSSFNLCRCNRIDRFSYGYVENNRKQHMVMFIYRSSRGGSLSSVGTPNRDDGISGDSTMDKIVEKMRKLRHTDEGDATNEKGRERGENLAASPFRSDGEVRFPWEKHKEKERPESGSVRMRSKTSLAELTLPAPELSRLRKLALQTERIIRVKGHGVSQEVMHKIRDKWKTSEVVRLRVEGAAALNMKRMHDIIERKTGGLVIWRSGTAVSLYRGVSYAVPLQQDKLLYRKRNAVSVALLPAANTDKTVKNRSEYASSIDMGAARANIRTDDEDIEGIEPTAEVKYEDEVDKLLDGLGPRYTDWPGCNPLPIDADLLPGRVSGYQPPYRILPYGVRPYIGIKDGTPLRRLAKVLPPHFALGRSRQLQGLAVAMIKLWERSSIAKIALKRGVQLTTSERMAEELKQLTGGTLLSRSKDFLVFYRGNDFLTPAVTEALLEKESLAKSLQDEEEQARLRASAHVLPNAGREIQPGIAGTLGETMDADARWGKRFAGSHKEKMMKEAEISRHARVVKKLEKKLALAEKKLKKAEEVLSKVEVFLKPTDRQAEPDSITEEERFMFRKLGLKMKAYLLLGRRGVFDGTVENMHLHWKYRELVKIIVNANTFEQVKKEALALEAESGGVLVSVDKLSKGYAVIVFRGKDYQRPSILRPKNLLTKRKALARSIEIQRREALLKHVSAVQNNVQKLRSDLEHMESVKDEGDEELYEKIESAYVSDDDDNSEEEGDEAYIDDETNSEAETRKYCDIEDQVTEIENEDAVCTAGADKVENQDLGLC